MYSVLQENPYRLADDISGVGFKIADEIAYRIGIHTDSDYRIKSGLSYTLLQAGGEGHVYLPKEELFKRAEQLLGVDASYMEKHLVDLSMERKIIQKEEKGQVLVYPAQYYYLELNTARMLRELDIDCPEDEAFVQRRPCHFLIQLPDVQHLRIVLFPALRTQKLPGIISVIPLMDKSSVLHTASERTYGFYHMTSGKFLCLHFILGSAFFTLHPGNKIFPHRHISAAAHDLHRTEKDPHQQHHNHHTQDDPSHFYLPLLFFVTFRTIFLYDYPKRPVTAIYLLYQLVFRYIRKGSGSPSPWTIQ